MRKWDRLDAAVFQRQNGGIGAAKGARQGVLRTQSVGSHRLLPEFSRQRLEIVLLEVLDSSEETVFRWRDDPRVVQFGRHEFECASNIGNLEKTMMHDGEPVVVWSPKLSEAEAAKRVYTTYGRKMLEGSHRGEPA